MSDFAGMWLLAVGALALASLVVVVALLVRRDTVGLAARLEALRLQQDGVERGLRDELARARQEQGGALRGVRDEVGETTRALRDSLRAGLADLARLQQGQLEAFANRLDHQTEAQDRRLADVRDTVAQHLAILRQEQTTQLEAVRDTVDARLQQTLEERLGASFRLVSERLEEVHRGLGEMQTLAAGVGDLKKVLANVKVRGTWGEVQLGGLLEQVLAPDQYGVNVATREGSDERVEFAIRLPGPGDDRLDAVWLPIDAKFPLEDYQRLVEAADRGDAASAETARRDLEMRIRQNARAIRDKYLDVPRTTDFGILFLPLEGLYAEVLRRPGLVELLQQESRVLVAGPTTLWAILTSLRLGFRTLAIQKRSSEVWTLLGAVKSDFARFGTTLEAVQKKLGEASSKIDEARRGTRRIERRLREVQDLPAGEAGLVEAVAPQPAPLFDEVAIAAEGEDA